MRAQSDLNFLASTLDSYVEPFRRECGVSDDVMLKCWRKFTHRTVKPQMPIIEIGDIGEEFYVLLEGKASVWKPQTEEKYLSASEIKAMKLLVGNGIQGMKELGKPEDKGGVQKTKYEITTMVQLGMLARGASFGETAIQKNIPRYVYIYYIYIYILYTILYYAI